MSLPIVVLGSLNADLVVTCTELPQRGQTVFGNGFHRFPGGKGANQAVAAARLGGAVRHIGAVGDDETGAWLVAQLRANGVDVEGIAVTAAAPTGTALITVDHAGQNTIVVVPGANAQCSPAQAERELGGTRAAGEAAGILLLQLEVPLETVEAAARAARRSGHTVILNPAPVAALPETLLASCDCVIPNETEAAALTGLPVDTIDQAITAAQALRTGRDGRVIVTLGSRGSVYAGPEGAFHQPPWPVEAVDATAAGDCFVAAFAVALANGTPLREALAFASAAGALTATKLGAQASLPTAAEVRGFMQGRVRP
ncbi:MAG: ribokinase [Chitinophagales bacterium]